MSTGGRTIPSVTGGGLSRAAGAIFEAKVAKRELEQRDRQIDIQDSQNALAQITALLPFLERGTLLSDLDPATQIQFGRAMGVDPAEFQEVELNRETLASMIEAITINRVGDLSDEDKVKDEVFRAQLGLEPLQAVADLDSRVAALQLEGIEGMAQDPERLLEFQQRFQGLDPITVEFPDGTPDRQFDRAAEAQLFVTMLGQESASEYEFAKLDADTQAEAVSNIQAQMEERQFLIGAPAVVRLFSIYDAAIAAEKESPGSGQALLDAFSASGASEGEKVAMNLISGAIPFGLNFLLAGLPPEAQQAIQGSAELADLLVRIEAADPDQLGGLLEQLPAAAGRIEKRGPFSFFGFGTPNYILPASEGGPTEQGGTGTPPPIQQFTREENIQGVRENLNTLPRAQLVERMGEEIVAAAEALGAIDREETPPPVVEPEPVEPTEADVEAAAARAGVHAPSQQADREIVITSEQRRLDRLLQLRENVSNPQFIDESIVALRAEIAIQQAIVPFDDAGLILVDSVPASVKAAAARYNSIQNILNRTTSGAGRRRRIGNQQSLLREIQTAIAQG